MCMDDYDSQQLISTISLISLLLSIVSLIVTWANMDDLVSYEEFRDKEEKRIQKKLAKKVNKK